MPLARPLGQGLWEVRTGFAGNRDCAGDFCFHEDELVALTGFMKKSRKTPQGELDLARARRRTCRDEQETRRNRHHGSGIDDLLKEEGVLEQFQATAIKEVISWQLQKAMKEKKLSKNKMAELMHTSRAQLDRLLDPEQGNITIETLQRAANVLGRSVRIEIS